MLDVIPDQIDMSPAERRQVLQQGRYPPAGRGFSGPAAHARSHHLIEARRTVSLLLEAAVEAGGLQPATPAPKPLVLRQDTDADVLGQCVIGEGANIAAQTR